MAAASEAQADWAAWSLEDRIAVCQRFVDHVLSNADAVAEEISAQMGKPVQQALNEVKGMEERALAMMDMAPTVLAPTVLDEPGSDSPFRRKIVREPVGVVLCIAPFNYPLLTAVNCVVPALLAGNSVVLKSSPRTALVGHNVFKAGLEAAGAPANVLVPLDCDNAVTLAAVENPDVAFVSFTGSVAAGHAVHKAAAGRFINCTLELGGKDAAYVAPDAPLDAAAAGLMDGAMYNAGQSCCGIERIYVHSSVYEAFLDKAQAVLTAPEFVLGDPTAAGTAMGPLASDDAPAFLKEQVDEAVGLGARLLCGGNPCTDAAGKGNFFQPTLLADCDHRMSVMTEESFGPVVAVAAVDSDDEAVELMNDSLFGLTAAVFTKDHKRYEAMAARLDVGTVFRNRCDYLDPRLPWSGRRDSGKGVSLSAHGFDGVTRLKAYNAKIAE